MKIASIVLFILLIAALAAFALTANALKFTKAQLAKCFDFHRDSVTNHVEALIDRGVIDNVKNLTLYQSSHGLPMTLYDLKVFNYLVMRLDTDKAENERVASILGELVREK